MTTYPMRPAAEEPEPDPADMGEGAEETEPTSIFLSKENLGGRTVAKGDTITLTVDDIDPETGEAQCSVSAGAPEDKDHMAAFDEAV